MKSLALVVCLAVVGCAARTPPTVVVAPTSEVDFLLKHQDDDGAWRADRYAVFKDGSALTPLIVVALQHHPEPESLAARNRGAAFLANLIESKEPLPFPVYTAALSVVALSHPQHVGEHRAARDAWLKFLLERQLTTANGWQESDVAYGGWGYYPDVPVKPAPGQAVPAQHLLETNISATRFALQALHAAKDALTAEELRSVVAAVEIALARLTNADGGGFFVHGDPVRNKAGLTDGRPRSYGSSTCDLILARKALAGLRGIGRKPDAALDWLNAHFDADRHPGDYLPAHEPNRNAVHFYYLAAAADVYADDPAKLRLIQAALAKRRNADGSLANGIELVREDEPLLATAYAVIAGK